MPSENHQNPHYRITPRYWVERRHVETRLADVWPRRWLLAFRKTSSAKLERTLVGCVLPYAAVNDKAPLILLNADHVGRAHLFLGCFNSIVADYVARQKVGGTDIGYYHIDQFPFPRPSDFSDEDDAFIRPRVMELTFTADDARPFAADLGWKTGPFRWDPERRLIIQCELDAYFAHFYGLSREESLFILDPHDLYGPSYPGESFRVLKEKEMYRYGEFRTKRTVLEIYDAMQRATEAGDPYQTVLDPPPADPRVAHAASDS